MWHYCCLPILLLETLPIFSFHNSLTRLHFPLSLLNDLKSVCYSGSFRQLIDRYLITAKINISFCCCCFGMEGLNSWPHTCHAGACIAELNPWLLRITFSSYSLEINRQTQTLCLKLKPKWNTRNIFPPYIWKTTSNMKKIIYYNF